MPGVGAEKLVSESMLLSEETGKGTLALSWELCQLLRQKGKPHSVGLEDCVGASANHNVLVLHCVPKRAKRFCSSPRRTFTQVKFACSDSEQAERWAAAVWNVINGKAPDVPPPPPKRWLVLINPCSGPGRASSIFRNQCRPVLEAHRVQINEIVTTHAGHAAEIAAEVKPEEVDAVVCVGGDGLLYEFINGMMKRPDADDAVGRLQLGVLPGGSANSLCVSLLKVAGEPVGPVAMSWLLCRGRPQPLDLQRVTQPGGAVSYSFLGLQWALASDIDLGSEHLRWMGEARFDVYAVWRILTQRRYPGTVRVREQGADAWRTLDGPFLLLWTCNTPWLSPSAQLAPRARLADGAVDVLAIRPGRKAGRLRILLTFLDLESGKHLDAPFLEQFKATAVELSPQPRTEKEAGMVAIDGELMPFADTALEVLPAKLAMLGGAPAPHDGAAV